MSKSKHVKVIIRTRPTSHFAQDVIKFANDKKSVHIHVPKDDEGGYINNQQENWNFKFDKILHNASQETVYDECAAPIVKSLLDGYNGTVLAYGQTGAGKTFTMTGASESFKHRGLIPRTISQLYREISDRPQMAFTVRISYLEIYNEQMMDLLATLPDAPEESNLHVVEDKNGVSTVRGLNSQISNSEEEALNYLFEGETNRSIAEHQLNKSSTRSHCIFTIHVEARSRVESSERVIYSKLNLVDLAGSERISKTHTTGVSLKEAMYINKTLTFLEQVIIALADKKRDHIPYRQTKLTNVLRDALGGNCNTLLIANIWGERDHIEETISTLRFATRMMCVSTTPQLNVQYDPMALIKKYEREIRELKQELSMHDTLSNRSHVNYESYSEAQKMEILRIVRQYVDSEIEEIEILNLRQIKEILAQFKNLVKSAEDDDVKNSSSQSGLSKASAIKEAEKEIQSSDINTMKDIERDDGVGEMDGGGFGIGVAPSQGKRRQQQQQQRKKLSNIGGKSAGPSQLQQILNGDNTENEDDEDYGDHHHHNHHHRRQSSIDDQTPGLPPLPTHPSLLHDRSASFTKQLKQQSSSPPNRAEEFESFKRNRGVDMNKVLIENKGILRDKKKNARDVAEHLNHIKEEIDDIKDKLHKKNGERHNNRGDDDENLVIDEEEYSLLNSLKQLKSQYRTQYETLKQLRNEIEYCSRLVDSCRQRLMSEFEQWYENSYGQLMDANFTVNNTGNNNNHNSNGNTEDVIDIGEKFEKLQTERMSHEDPDSLPYYNAKRNRDRKKNVNLKSKALLKTTRKLVK